MATIRDLSGHWTGFYTRHDHPRPLSADFDHQGGRLTGSMDDGCTRIETPLSQLAMEEGLPPGTDEQIVARLRTIVPDAERGPVRAEMEVPPHSHVEGEVAGKAVRFQKTYQGPLFAGYRIGDTRVGLLAEGHEAHFRGIVSADGTEIEGSWILDDLPGLGLHSRVEGGFWLRRAAVPGEG